LNKRAVVLISILGSLWIAFFVLFILITIQNRDNLISYVPDDAVLYIHIKPNQQQYDNLHELIDDFPLIDDFGLNYFGIDKSSIDEIGIVVLNDFQKIVLLSLKRGVYEESITKIETLGLRTTQLNKNTLLVSKGLISNQYYCAPRIDWTNLSIKSFGSVHMYGSLIGRLKIDEKQINLDLNTKGTEHELSLNFVPNETIAYLSMTDLQHPLFVQPILDKVFGNDELSDITELFSNNQDSSIELLFLAKNKQIHYLITGQYNNNQEELVNYLKLLISDKKTNYSSMVLPDYTSINEILTNTTDLDFEYIPLDNTTGTFSLNLGNNEINYFIDDEQVYISNSIELLLNYINPLAYKDNWTPIDNNAVAVLFPQKLANYFNEVEGLYQNTSWQTFINIRSIQFFNSNIMFLY